MIVYMRLIPEQESPQQESEELGWQGTLAVVACLLPHESKSLKKALLTVFIFTGSTGTSQDNPYPPRQIGRAHV